MAQNKKPYQSKYKAEDFEKVVETLFKDSVFGGVAHPNDPDPKPVGNTVYLASEVGTYTNYGGVKMTEEGLAVISYKVKGEWNLARLILEYNMIFLNGNIKNIIGVETNFFFDSLHLKAFINRDVQSSPEAAAQAIVVTAKDGEKIYTFRYEVNKGGDIIHTNEKITIQEYNDKTKSITLYVRWGYEPITFQGNLEFNKGMVNEGTPEIRRTFPTINSNRLINDGDALIGDMISSIRVDFKFKNIFLDYLINRDATGQSYASQLAFFRVEYEDETFEEFNYVDNGKNILNKIENLTIENGNKHFTFHINWLGKRIETSSSMGLLINPLAVSYDASSEIKEIQEECKKVDISIKELSSGVEEINSNIEVSKNLLDNDMSNFFLDRRITVLNGTARSVYNENTNKQVVCNKPILLKKNTVYCVSGALLEAINYGYIFKNIEDANNINYSTTISDVGEVNFEEIPGGYRFTTPDFETPYFVCNWWCTSTNQESLNELSQIEKGESVSEYVLYKRQFKPALIPILPSDKVDFEGTRIDTLIKSEDISSYKANFILDERTGSISSFEKTIPDITDDATGIIYFRDSIKAIDFEIADVWDGIHVGFVVGRGEFDSSQMDFAKLQLFSLPSQDSTVYNLYNPDSQVNSIDASFGRGGDGNPSRFETKALCPQAGDKYRLEIIADRYIKGTINRNGEYIYSLLVDTKGTWVNPVGSIRTGWNKSLCLGFAMTYSRVANDKIKNIRVYRDEENPMLLSNRVAKLEQTLLPKRFPKLKWTAIGDSITDINHNNGKSYIGFVNRNGIYDVFNAGKSGWTIFRLWTKRDEVWEESVKTADIVTIFAGTNDFDTTALGGDVPEDLDYHPQFGETEPESPSAKNPMTTLGCLRLMIERIYELNKKARIYIIAPIYREKGNPADLSDKLFVNTDGRTIYDYADAICNVAKEYNIPCVNLARISGLNKFNVTYFLYDYLHPNENGGELLGDIIGKLISR